MTVARPEKSTGSLRTPASLLMSGPRRNELLLSGYAPLRLSDIIRLVFCDLYARAPFDRHLFKEMESAMSKKIIVTEYISLDGVVEGPVGWRNRDLATGRALSFAAAKHLDG